MEAENPAPTSDTKIDSPSKTNGPVTWSIRGVERDTRSVIEKAAERAGKTMGQYVNEDIRSLVQGQLSQSQLPAAPVDLQNQMDHLTKMVEALTNRMPEQGKKSFWQLAS
ncbi:hypothetical protein [Spirosoma pollinicola]|uniref:Uncharacterized protein n=1 Tax=Spirosoma pollinicola TaxID=2057025 RepID=A0A2K8ZAB9_9BACT|nr:hypothetical protein [Spirosoma pollinicola]AUD06795.1 hypothetical protein CWM47_36080 [Spirosoma pollinicola]